MMNHMKDVAEMFGVKIGEAFMIKGRGSAECFFLRKGLQIKGWDGAFDFTMAELLRGALEIVKIEEREIHDEEADKG